MRGCVESEFDLADDSRLPAWFSLPAGMQRGDVSVHLSYWTSGENAEFELVDSHTKLKWTFQTKRGVSCWHPATRYRHNSDGTWSQPGGPEYSFVTIDGITEVMEFPEIGGPFRMSDDKSLIAEAKATAARGECRNEPYEARSS